MSIKKQTAVDWLVDKLPIMFKYESYYVDILQQAKAMEKQQIEKAYNESWRLRDKPYLTALQYYNETYGS